MDDPNGYKIFLFTCLSGCKLGRAGTEEGLLSVAFSTSLDTHLG